MIIKMRALKLRLLIILLIAGINVYGQSKVTRNPEADKAYDELTNIFLDNLERLESLFNSKDSIKQALCLKLKQDQYSRFQNQGLKFWNQFPNDKRKYQWLVKAVSMSYLDNYWENIDSAIRIVGLMNWHSAYNIPIDWRRLSEWEKWYPTLKNDFLKYYTSDPANLKSEYYNLLIGELSQFLSLSRNLDYRKSEKIDLNKLKQLFIATSSILSQVHDEVVSKYQTEITNLMDNNFLAIYKRFGLTEMDLTEFFGSLRNDTSMQVRKWASQRSSLFSLSKIPLHIKWNSIDGREINLDLFKGKVVLLDFWTTWCSNCIARMPAIKAIYEKYKADGFEVISISLNTEADIEAVKKIKQKIGADWPTLIIGGKNLTEYPNSFGVQLWETYGFSGVPQLLLLNKRGELALLNNELRDGDFEPILQKLLITN